MTATIKWQMVIMTEPNRTGGLRPTLSKLQRAVQTPTNWTTLTMPESCN